MIEPRVMSKWEIVANHYRAQIEQAYSLAQKGETVEVNKILVKALGGKATIEKLADEAQVHEHAGELFDSYIPAEQVALVAAVRSIVTELRALREEMR